MNRKVRLVFSSALLAGVLFIWSSCGRAGTEKLLLHKKWEVYNVTPPSGIFNIEDNNRANELRDGFYKGAWFKFLPDSIFIAFFQGKADTGKYHISANGKSISLYPRRGGKMYEQMRIQQLSADKMKFNTVVADFRMVLHLKTTD